MKAYIHTNAHPLSLPNLNSGRATDEHLVSNPKRTGDEEGAHHVYMEGRRPERENARGCGERQKGYEGRRKLTLDGSVGSVCDGDNG